MNARDARRLNARETALYGALLRLTHPGKGAGSELSQAAQAEKDLLADHVARGDLPPPVVCACCEAAYPEAVPGGHASRQGSDCAVHVQPGGRTVYGSYGSSRHDMERLIFVGGHSFAEGDVLCDDCVDAMLAKGDLAFPEAA